MEQVPDSMQASWQQTEKCPLLYKLQQTHTDTFGGILFEEVW